MADDPNPTHNRLERHAKQPLPPIDPAFANRLESQLRVDHAAATSPRRWAARSVIPRMAVAAALVVAGVVGVTSLAANDPGVPVVLVDDEQAALLDAPTLDDGQPVDVTVTPTPTLVEAQGINEAGGGPAVLVPDDGSAGPTTAAMAPTDPTPTSLPTQSTVPVPATTLTPDVSTAATANPITATPTPTIVTPTPTPTSVTPTPTVIPSGTTPVPVEATAVPVPTATAVPEPTSTATPEPRPTTAPTPETEPAPIALTCGTRTAGDAVGVVCTWAEPVTDQLVSWYEVLRSRNGGEVEVVSRQRAGAATSYVDRNVEAGDEATYLVQALDTSDQVVGASIRQIVPIS